jgi:hypothetical protein
MIPTRARRGVVLATALYYLAVLALLVVGTVYAARGARGGADGATADAMLTGALDRALANVVASWRPPERAKQPVGTSAPVTIEFLRGTAGTASIARLGPSLYWIFAEVRSERDAQSRRRATLLVHANVAQPIVQSPIVSQGDVVVGEPARIVADSSAPEDCPAAPSTVLALGPDATLRDEGMRDTSVRITAARVPEAGSAETFDRFGAESWSTLADKADVRLAADTALTPRAPLREGCGVARAVDDWSDRTAADGCDIAPPIVLAAGDLTIPSGAGTGLLLVQGRLRITGPFLFTGVIVARGGVEITGDGAEVTGSILAARLTTTSGVTPNASLVVNGHAIVRASSCTAYRVFASRSGIRSVRARAWLEHM